MYTWLQSFGFMHAGAIRACFAGMSAGPERSETRSFVPVAMTNLSQPGMLTENASSRLSILARMGPKHALADLSSAAEADEALHSGGLQPLWKECWPPGRDRIWRDKSPP